MSAQIIQQPTVVLFKSKKSLCRGYSKSDLITNMLRRLQ
jgi:hypothetical protein